MPFQKDYLDTFTFGTLLIQVPHELFKSLPERLVFLFPIIAPVYQAKVFFDLSIVNTSTVTSGTAAQLPTKSKVESSVSDSDCLKYPFSTSYLKWKSLGGSGTGMVVEVCMVRYKEMIANTRIATL